MVEPSGDAADHFHRYPEDMRLLADAGLNSYRFSVEWARIEPERGFVSRAMLDHYRRMIDTARENGLDPTVTLMHFTVPQWFQKDGFWRADDAVDLFARYVETVLPILDGHRLRVHHQRAEHRRDAGRGRGRGESGRLRPPEPRPRRGRHAARGAPPCHRDPALGTGSQSRMDDRHAGVPLHR